VIMRGGTSRAVFLKENDLPEDPALRDRIILSIFGSPDKRQIDGVAGADPLTSKLAIIGPPRVAGTDLTYTFGQVEIDHPAIDYKSLCGNISSAVGAYAIWENLVVPTAPITRVNVFNTNLNRVLRIEVPVGGREPLESGDYKVPGVPGTGARIYLDFADTAGGATGELLPTGNPVDRLNVEGFGELEVSLVDIGNAHVFVRARDIGMKGTEAPDEIDADKKLGALLERIRGAAAQRMKMASSAAAATSESPATPIIGCVAPAADYRDFLTGDTVRAQDIDLVSRLQFMQRTHKTYAGTSTVCTGVASRIRGTLVHEVSRPPRDGSVELRIGHPGGIIVTESQVTPDNRVLRATLGRTARRIMEGYAYVPDAVYAAG
jgi:2-methylaconitate cis-trans-isomerase PrpF